MYASSPRLVDRRRAGVAVELGAGGQLLAPDAAGDDHGARVALGSHRRADHPAQERELTDVRQRIGERPLEDLLRRGLVERSSCEQRVELGERGEQLLAAGFADQCVAPRAIVVAQRIRSPRCDSSSNGVRVVGATRVVACAAGKSRSTLIAR